MINLSQSIIKRFEEEDYCPAKIRLCDIERIYEREETLAMRQGSYFETKLLGAGAKGKVVTDLPRKKLTKAQIENGETVGAKRVAHERIDAQVQNAKKLMRQLGIKFPSKNYVQVFLSVPVEEFEEDEVYMNLTIDFISNIDHELYGKHPFVIYDVKLTGNVDNTYGPYCWGAPENMDHLQAEAYTLFFMRHFKDHPLILDGFVPPFIYLVFDHSADMKHKVVPFNYDAFSESNVLERIRITKDKWIREAALEWEYRPNWKHCEKCPVAAAGDCPVAPNQITV